MALSVADLKWCSIDTWYPKFRRQTIKTKLVPLTPDFVQLLAHGSFVQPFTEPGNEESISFSDEDDDAGSSSSAEELPSLPASAEQMQTDIEIAIEELGGKVAPKLNWSAPKDAVWINAGGDLKCFNAAQVWLLLKSSDRVAHDLHEALAEASAADPDPLSQTEVCWTLALRKWSNLVPSSEFRCFVVNSRLIGISQRDDSQHYEFLLEQREEIIENLQDFYDEHVSGVPPMDSYVFDTYITKERRVYLLDFGPLGDPTLPLLFDWEELQAIALESTPSEELPILRLVEQRGVIRASVDMLNRLPLDFYTLPHSCSTEDANEMARVQGLIGQMQQVQTDEHDQDNEGAKSESDDGAGA